MMEMRQRTRKKLNIPLFVLIALPISVALWVWLSSLSFVPVPWPDDSAFYFVAKELFHWPPRWVMLPQAPFESTYRIFNFNTMPLYPILIGLGRFIGIDGSFLLKLWPLGAWAFTGSLLASVLYKKGLPFFGCVLLSAAFAFDPELRWASVLVRPESLIGLFGMLLVLGLTFGFPKRLEPNRFWDPVAALLALGAYSHFNAIHLVFPVLVAFYNQPKRLFKIAAKSTLYLSPWILTVLTHFDLFMRQMDTQWTRLNVPNGWLNSIRSAIEGLFQSMGSPEPWPTELAYAGAMITFLFLAMTCVGIGGFARRLIKHDPPPTVELLPSIAWTLSAVRLFHTKPEVWFVYYIHTSFWCMIGVSALKLWLNRTPSFKTNRNAFLMGLASAVSLILAVFLYTDISQANKLSASYSWHWNTYYDFVDCVDDRLVQLEKKLNTGKPFNVWCPTFPDIMIELSRRHPDWQLTRTNDFYTRNDQAVQHGWATEAVVVTETLTHSDRHLSIEASRVPEVQSAWMLWKDHYLNRLWIAPGWKPNRYICQRGRWQAFLFMRPED